MATKLETERTGPFFASASSYKKSGLKIKHAARRQGCKKATYYTYINSCKMEDVSALMCLSLYLKEHSSDILLREQFLNVSLAPVGLNFLVLEDYGKNVSQDLR